MNAFKNDDSVFMHESGGRHRGARATKDGWGWIEVTSIRIAGQERVDAARYPQAPDETVLELPLDQPVAPGDSIELDMTFEVQLPEVFARTGYKGEFAMVGQWFPKIGVLVGEPGRETWHCEPFHLNSEFFADFGTYDVNLTVPDTHVVAATGVLTAATQNNDGTRVLTYRAEDVHDFVWMIDPHMKSMSAKAQTDNGPVEVRVYYRRRQEAFARRHLTAGVGAIEQFSRMFYAYPWPIMSIIDPPLDAAGGAGGMEYPTLVTTAGDSVFLPPGVRMPEYVTVHEVGHNWFQGILASNEVDEAWMDEGINDYADSLVMDALHGEDANMIDWRGLRGSQPDLGAARSPASALPAPIATVSHQFPDFSSYGGATYSKTSRVLRTLENLVGRDEFRRAMRAYAQRYAFRHPDEDAFFETLERELGRELDWYVEPAFHQVGAVEFQVRDIRCRRDHDPRGVFGRGDERKTVTPDDAPDKDQWICELQVVNLGRVPAPADVRIEFSDGKVERKRWIPVPGRAWEKIRVEHSARVTRVTIDPERRVPLNDSMSARDVCTDPDSSASRRAAARMQFWTQSAMQVMGL
jgi:hypothetical protein